MNPNDLPTDAAIAADPQPSCGADLLRPLMQGAANGPLGTAPLHGAAIGDLVALGDDGATAFVRHAVRGDGSVTAARTTVELHARHIGAAVVLVYEAADPARPVVIGTLRSGQVPSEVQAPDHVELDADGRRLIVQARDQLVLRCGSASITLTKAGKVLIEGSYVCSRATGTNRIKGGSIQLN